MLKELPQVIVVAFLIIADHWKDCFDQWMWGILRKLIARFMLPEPKDFKEDLTPKLRDKPTRAGWTSEVHSVKRSSGVSESRGPTQRDPWTGSVHLKSYEYSQEVFTTRSVQFQNPEEDEIVLKNTNILTEFRKGRPYTKNAQIEFETYLRYIIMSQTPNRKEKRHSDKMNKEEIAYGTPRLEHFLKGSIEHYSASINRSVTAYLQAGNTLPYHFVQVEYNVMKGFVPVEAFSNTAPPEELAKLRIIENPNQPGQQGIEGAYITLHKILHLTPETLARKQAETASGGKGDSRTDLANGTHRVTLYQAMVPLSDAINFPKARYRLLEDIMFHLTSLGMEYQERRNIEENEKLQQMQREDVQEKVKEVEQMFTISKGGLNQEEEVALDGNK